MKLRRAENTTATLVEAVVAEMVAEMVANEEPDPRRPPAPAGATSRPR